MDNFKVRLNNVIGHFEKSGKKVGTIPLEGIDPNKALEKALRTLGFAHPDAKARVENDSIVIEFA